MPPAPPSFGSQKYWDNRFSSNPIPFEWLDAPDVFDPYLVAALKKSRDPSPRVLHIGCGTSLLSYHLRTHVQRPDQIHNLDYSKVAIEVGQSREIDMYNAEQTAELSHMRWSAANLLDYVSLLQACQPCTYSAILDKSTSDSIACSDDICIPLPYHVTTSLDSLHTPALAKLSEQVHPLHIMAVHLAVITRPKSRWISLSYSSNRFPFLNPPLLNPTSMNLPATENSSSRKTPPPTETEPGSVTATVVESKDPAKDVSLNKDLDGMPRAVIDSGFPHPGVLWNLVEKHEIEPPAAQPSNGHGGLETTHRPRVLHWLYVLERTEIEIFVRKN